MPRLSHGLILVMVFDARLWEYNNNIMMVKVEFKQDAVGARHHHPHSQSTYVVSGVFELTIGNETRIIKPGDGFFAAPDIEHEVVCIEDGVLLECFQPCTGRFFKITYFSTGS